MARRKSQKQLEFESLESMELLSVAGMAMPHAMIPHHLVTHAQVHRARSELVPGIALALSGSGQGTYRMVSGGSAATFTGRGNFSGVGNARLQGSIALDASGDSGQMTLNLGRRGKLFVSVSGLTTSGGGITYQITGGTKTFAGDTGSGTGGVTFAPFNIARGHFFLTLQAGPST
jgi:hypothetical protein